jgi:hypothetical protein
LLVAVVERLAEDREGFDEEGAEAVGGGLVELFAALLEFLAESGGVKAPADDGGAVEAKRGCDGGVGFAGEDQEEGVVLLGGEGVASRGWRVGWR